MRHGRVARKPRTHSRQNSQLLRDPIREPRHVGSLWQDDGHFDLSEVVAPFVEFQLSKVAKRPRSDEPDGRCEKQVVREGPSDILV